MWACKFVCGCVSLCVFVCVCVCVSGCLLVGRLDGVSILFCAPDEYLLVYFNAQHFVLHFMYERCFINKLSFQFGKALWAAFTHVRKVFDK